MINVPTPEAQAVLDMLARDQGLLSLKSARGPDELLAAWRAIQSSLTCVQGAPLALHSVTDCRFEGAGSALTIRIYRPADGILPTLLYFHGGAFTGGSIAGYDTALRRLSHATGWIVAAAQYRLAPEHPYPAAPEDCHAALIRLANHGSSLGIDPTRIVAAGDSAGGLLAASVALMTRDRHGPQLAGIACLYPNFDLRADRFYPSMAAHDGKVFNLRHLHGLLDLYLPDGIDRSEPYASPGLAPDLTGLPPALILTCECDPICDEGNYFAKRLRGAGVIVDDVRLNGMIHGVVPMMGLLPNGAALMMSSICSYLRGLAGGPVSVRPSYQRRQAP